MRVAVGLLRLTAATSVVSRGAEYLNWRTGMACLEKLIQLQTALGGEMGAIVATKYPNHPLLRWGLIAHCSCACPATLLTSTHEPSPPTPNQPLALNMQSVNK